MVAHPLGTPQPKTPRAAVLIAAALLVFSMLPLAVAWAAQGTDWHFAGSLLGAEDGNSYLGKMRLGATGAWDFSLFYTTEPHAGAPLVFLPYLAAGRLVSLVVPEISPAHTSALIIAFHLFRLAANAAYLAVLWRFVCRFVSAPGTRVTAYLLACLGGGLGFLAPVLNLGTPPEFYIPEGFSPLVMLILPHVALSRVFMLGGLLCFFAALDTPADRPVRRALVAGFCWVVVGLCVPFYLPVLYAVLGAWGAVAWLKARRFPPDMLRLGLIACAPSLPFFVWYFYVFSANPAFAVWSAQNLLPSPSPLTYALAYIVLAVPAIVGAREAWRRASEHRAWLLLIAWPVAAALLVYIPLNVQRRMSEAVIVPLAILAAIGLLGWAGRSPLRHRAAVAWTMLGTLSSILLLVAVTGSLALPGLPLFRPAPEADMLAWLNTNSPPGTVVLASPATGNVLPAAAHLRPVMGHGPETLEWQRKTLLVRQFFAGEMTPDESRALLDGGGCLESAPSLCGDPVDYIIFGPLETALRRETTAPAPDFAALGFTLRYDDAGYQVWAANRLSP
ncbi:MAG: hypothetical protein KME04_19925 [Pleurocapsa minor GSE-CHR-MK-17-07R]|jgi:hypothetical protein|nr:hypothetical protein [Pleurocapsa minor GSE-CHR-MK 17-07R]